MRGNPGFVIRDVLYGALVTAVCTALSFILALTGFGRLYYIAVFLPFFMLACLLVAWFLYLKDDGFIPSARTAGIASSAVSPDSCRSGSHLPDSSFGATGPSGGMQDRCKVVNPGGAEPAHGGYSAGRPDLSLYAPLGEELVPGSSGGLHGRRSALEANQPCGGWSGDGGGTAAARRALLWAAVQLGLLAAALYSWAGVGAGYFNFIPVAP